ncbi:MAG: response regulator [Chlamydiae bacterium]|nr:response regulator [Chlamydiota bacterium]
MGLKMKSTGNKKSLDKILELEVKKYRETIPQKIAALEKLITKAKSKSNESSFQELEYAFHKLAGSAGTYGYGKVSEIAKQIVGKIREWLLLLPKKEIKKAQIKELQDLFSLIKEEFKAKEVSLVKEEAIFPLPIKQLKFSLDLYILDGDDDFLRMIAKEAKSRNLHIQAESDPEKVWDQIKSKEFNPRIFIVGPCYYEKIDKNLRKSRHKKQPIDPYEIIDEYRKNHKEGVVGVILPEVDFQQRIAAIKKKIDYILEKPCSVKNLLNIAESVIPTYFVKPLKVMVLDDDEDICLFIKDALEEINVKVETLCQAGVFFKQLKSFVPDLLFLDLSLVHFNGLEILQTIRSDARFKDLPVIVITAYSDVETIKRAYMAKVDDYITKPLVKGIIQSKVMYFARILSFKEIIQTQDFLTGLYTEHAFLYLLAQKFEKIGLEKKESSIAIIGIDKFDAINTTEQAEMALVEVANSLSETFKAFELIGRTNKNDFIIFLEGIRGPLALSLVTKFINNVDLEIALAKKSKRSLTLSGGVSIYPLDGKNSLELIKLAQKFLSKAKKITNTVVGSSKAKTISSIIQEVFILDDDLDIQRLLNFAFKREGFKVTLAGSFKEAVLKLRNRQGAELPALCIFDRMLPDGDGLELYRKLKKEFVNFPAVMFLSKLSNEKDVILGLKEGAIDYITKPFSIQVLMQKALKLLEGS